MAYLRLLLSDDASGWLVVAGPDKTGRWRERPFAWPQDAERAVEQITEEDDAGRDVFVCPVVLCQRRRGGAAPAQLRWIHADVDHGDVAAQDLDHLGAYCVASGTAGHLHVYVHVDRDLTAHEYRALAKGLKERLKGDNKITPNDLLRPAGTRNHKDPACLGEVVDVTDGEIKCWSPESLAAVLGVDLKAETVQADRESNRTHTSTHPLRSTCVRNSSLTDVEKLLSRVGQPYRRMIIEGSWEKYPSRSEARPAIACHMLQRDLSLEDFRALVLHPEHGSAFWYKKKDPQLTTEQDWAAAAAHIQRNPQFTSPDDFTQYLGELDRAAQQTPMTGPGGATDREVLRALHDHARSLRRLEVDISVRDIASLVGRAPETVARSLHRLEDRGWVRRLSSGDRHLGHSASFRLLLPEGSRVDPGHAEPFEVAAHDYWSSAAPSAKQIFEHLPLAGTSPADIAARTGRHVKTVQEHLRHLKRDGLAAETSTGWVRSFDSHEALQQHLDEHTQHAGAAGLLERRAESYTRQRTAFHEKRRVGFDARGWRGRKFTGPRRTR